MRSGTIMLLKIIAPPFSGPIRFSAGTSTLLNTRRPVPPPRVPMSPYTSCTSTPISRSTRIRLMDSWPGALGSMFVRTYTTKKSAPLAPTMNRFWPLSTYTPPFFSAVVVAPKKSLPPRGSVRASAEILSPLSMGTRYFCFCASLPNFVSASPTMLGME